MVTSEGLAERLQWRVISLVMKAHRSRFRRATGDATKASRKALRSDSPARFSGAGIMAGWVLLGNGDMFCGRGEDLELS